MDAFFFFSPYIFFLGVARFGLDHFRGVFDTVMQFGHKLFLAVDFNLEKKYDKILVNSVKLICFCREILHLRSIWGS